MTPLILQDAIKADLETLFMHRRFRAPSGDPTPIHVFRQHVPKLQSENDEDPYPYIIVRLDSGGSDAMAAPHKVAVLLLIGVYYDFTDNTGDDVVLEIIETIQHHYAESPGLNGMFRCVPPFAWTLQDEESFPYFFGGINLTWEIPAIRTKVSDYV